MTILINIIILITSLFIGWLLGNHFAQKSPKPLSQKEKERKDYDQVLVLQELTSSLCSSLEMRPVLTQISLAFKKLFPEATISYVIDPLSSPTVSKQAHILAPKGVGRKYLAAIEKSLSQALRDLPEAQSKPLQEWQLKTFYFQFLEGAQEKDSLLVPRSLINIPIMASGSMIGIINLSSFRQDIFNQSQQEVILTIAKSAGETIGRLKTLVLSEQSRLTNLFESMTNGVLMFDQEKKVLIANPVIRKIAGWKEETMPLVDFLTLFDQKKPPGERPDLFADIEEVLQRGVTKHIKEISLRGGVFEIFIVPVRTPQKQVSGGALILHDITEFKEINRMKSEFLSVAAHQLRSPLGIMRWNIEMILAGDFGKPPEAIEKTLEQVHQNNQRMITLVNDLLNVSRIEEGRVRDDPRPTAILKIIEENIAELQPQAKEKQVALELKISGPISPILIDPKRFREVISNLLTNAIKYNHPQGKVIMEINQFPKVVQIKVSDTGMGIPEKEHERVFSKFFRAANAIKSETEGSGLGLFVVKSYVEAWGGEIDFESQPGKGTTFTLLIPQEPKQHVLDKNLASRPQQTKESN